MVSAQNTLKEQTKTINLQSHLPCLNFLKYLWLILIFLEGEKQKASKKSKTEKELSSLHSSHLNVNNKS